MTIVTKKTLEHTNDDDNEDEVLDFEQNEAINIDNSLEKISLWQSRKDPTDYEFVIMHLSTDALPPRSIKVLIFN